METENIPTTSSQLSTNITVVFLKLIFIPFGIFMETSRKRFERTYTLVFLFVFLTLFAGQVKCYQTLDSLLYVLDNSIYVISTLAVTVFLLKARQDQSVFEEFYRNVISHEYAGNEFFNETDASLIRLATILGPLIVLSCIGIIVYPIVNASFTNVDLGSPSTLIYLSFYPWRIDTVPKYIATIVLQICSASVVCSMVGCMIFFLLYCIVVLQAHCNILTKKIRRVNKKTTFLDANVRVGWEKSDSLYRNIRCKIDEEIIEEFREMVKYHQFVNRFTYNIIACCTRIVDTSTAAVFSCIIILISIFLMGSGDYIYQLKIVSMSMITFCLFCIECYIGEILHHVNSEILSQAYDVKWYSSSSKFKKPLLMVMTRCQQPFQIKAFNMLNVNFLFFTTLLKNIYSVLQFILRMQKDRNM